MKKILLLTLCSLLLLAACDNTPRYTISGKIGNNADTLYLFGFDSRYDKIDKIASDAEGVFSHTIKADTITPLGLALPDGEIITLYAEPGTEARLIADSLRGKGWIVKGGAVQAQYDSIARLLNGAGSNSDRLVHIDRFIGNNPYSNVNIEVLRKYLAEKPNANNGHITKRIGNLGGTLQDHEFFLSRKEQLEQKNSNTPSKLLPSFNYTTATGKSINAKEYKTKLLILNFWAAWDSISTAETKEIGKIIAERDPADIALLNISLDYDKELWKHTIARDSIDGDNVCDSKAWENDLAKRFSITSLPYTIAISPYQRVDSYNIGTKELATTLDSLFNKYNKKNKKSSNNNKRR